MRSGAPLPVVPPVILGLAPPASTIVGHREASAPDRCDDAASSATTRPAPPDDAAASDEGLRIDSRLYLPLDMIVPVRTAAGNDVLAEVALRARFLLLHMDGVATLAEVVLSSKLPRADVLAAFLDLLDRGIVEMGVCEAAGGVPISGVYRGLSARRP